MINKKYILMNDKIREIIKSCTTIKHIEVTLIYIELYANQLKHKYGVEKYIREYSSQLFF